MKQDELDEILRLHKIWVQDNTKGKRADLGYTNLEGTNLYSVNLKGADLSHANLYDANLRYANLYDADLSHANLRNANLSHANLRNANLRYADLSHANLYSANLKYANLERNGVLTFQYNQHFAYSFNGRIKIGCEDHTTKYWLENYKEIGVESDYSEEEIEMYGMFIFMCHLKNEGE